MERRIYHQVKYWQWRLFLLLVRLDSWLGTSSSNCWMLGKRCVRAQPRYCSKYVCLSTAYIGFRLLPFLPPRKSASVCGGDTSELPTFACCHTVPKRNDPLRSAQLYPSAMHSPLTLGLGACGLLVPLLRTAGARYGTQPYERVSRWFPEATCRCVRAFGAGRGRLDATRQL
jgi:hypothetical protein